MRSIQSTLFTLVVASSSAYADTTLNLTPGVSPLSHDIYELHMIVFWICVAIGLVVFSVMFYSLFKFRKSKGAKAADFHSHTWLEIGWTIIPAVILILMAIPATKVLLNVNNEDKDDLTIKITGYQWKWHYDYLEDNVSFFSNLSTPYDQIHGNAPKGPDYLREVDHPLVVPIHKKIRFLITSNDVNHAWWVPDLGVKRDAISGFINEAWTIIDKPGTYRGQCAELCGINHAFMPIVIIATTEQGYKDWVAQQKGQASQGEAETNRLWTMQELMTQGEKVYSRICAACHQPGGVGLPPTFPALKGDKVTTGPIAEHIETVFNGRSGTAMQAFKNQLSDVELASVITYERNAFGNNTNTSVQPIQIKAYRDGKSITDALATQPQAGGAKPATTPSPTPTAPSTPPANNSGPASNASAGAVPATSTAAAPATPAVSVAATPAVSQAAAPAVPATSVPAASAQSVAAAPAVPATSTAAAPATPAASAPAQPVTASSVPSQPAAAVTTQTVTTTTTAPAPSTQPAASSDELKAAIARGEKVYLGTCAACHQPSGAGIPPTFPALKGSPIATGPVAGHIDRVMNGKPGTAMVAFKDQFTDQELADVITYERNAFGNNTGTLVKAEDIKAARQHPAKQ